MKNYSLTVDEKKKVKEAYENQRMYNDWNFYDERKFIENLLQTRFNFLMAAFGVFLSIFGMSKNFASLQLVIVLFIGAITTYILGLTVFRLYEKLMILLKIMRVLGDLHVAPVTDDILNRICCRKSGVNHLIGVIIPKLIPFFLLALAIIVFVCFIMK